jgi:Ca2+-binding RTX toxin-like protein
MPTYILTGLALSRDHTLPGDPITGINNGATLEFVVPDSTTTFSYTVDPLPPGGTAPDDLTMTLALAAQEVRLDGRTVDSSFQPEYGIYDIGWTNTFGQAQSATILIPFFAYGTGSTGLNNGGGLEYMFVLAGDPLPQINSVAEWDALGSTVTSLSVPTGAYAPDTPILLSDIGVAGPAGLTGTTGDDVLTGTAAGETIEGLAGNDTINGKGGDDRLSGGAGDDNIKGGAGDDIINPGENSYWDIVDAGRGNDTVIFWV